MFENLKKNSITKWHKFLEIIIPGLFFDDTLPALPNNKNNWYDNPKFCKDCRWYLFEDSDLCVSPSNKTNIDLITGERFAVSCRINREKAERCGLDAKWWESRHV